MSENRTETVRLRLTPNEKAKLKEMADGDLSGFIRSRIFETNPVATADVQVAQAKATVPDFKPASKKTPDKAAVIEDLQKKVDAVAPQMTREQWIKRRIMKPDLRVLPTPTARRIAEKELA